MSNQPSSQFTFLKCHKCGHVHDTKGFYAKAPGGVCGMSTGVDPAKAAGGFIVCRAKLRKGSQIEASSKKEAKEIARG